MAKKESENFDPIEMSEQQFDRATYCIKKLKKGLIEFLKKPKRVTIVNFPIEMDGKETERFANAEQFKNFFLALEDDEDPKVTGEQGRKSMEFMRGILKSVMVEGPVRFPLVDMQQKPFVHNVNYEKNLIL